VSTLLLEPAARVSLTRPITTGSLCGLVPFVVSVSVTEQAVPGAP
jgi:hypothetical protein